MSKKTPEIVLDRTTLPLTSSEVPVSPQMAQRVTQDFEVKSTLKKIKKTIVVQSGKGGVGKSTVTYNLALAFAKKGYTVGIMDADVTGPSIPLMAGLENQYAKINQRKIIPTEINGIHIISMDLLLNQETPVIWRGPLKIAALKQFLSDVMWPELDILFIDLPPGTSDEPLTIAQLFENVTGTVIVTTPQKVATHDVQKSIGFANKVGMPIIGIIENMSGLTCPHCGELVPVFKIGGGKKMAEKLGLVFLGAIPLEPELVIKSDNGENLLTEDNKFAESFDKITEKVGKMLQLN